jgi:dTDP-4-amino-4,6-dideoxygalactose transaminase
MWLESKVGSLKLTYQIPVMRPSLPSYSAVQQLLQGIDASHIYSNNGPLVKDLEIEYANYLGTDPSLIVAVGNATQALQGLVEISVPEKWYCPDYTFSATGLAIVNSTKSLLLCDVSLDSWQLDTSNLLEISNSIGILPVMPFGAEICFSHYDEFSYVIIDAAASLGRIPPNISDMKNSWSIVYSLHATKVLGAGEGAIAVCGNLDMAKNLRSWINFGFSGGRESIFFGTNAKMSEFNAAYGLASIKKFNSERNLWLDSQSIVSELTKDRHWRTQVNATPEFQPYWIAGFRSLEERNYVQSALIDLQIQSRCWWEKPLSKQNAFTNTSKIGQLTNSTILASTHLGLPMYQGLQLQEIRYIIESIDEILERNDGIS